ncbi:MAG TPA: alcohol dehydrogenase catalytic domain-containing protein [Armatimonadota bacterium]|nr:alcohol dehydrogenase catalytic domain-containing protein [Armatimonadota bacterium]HOP79516.1 alcohol dehydrogenase catalytic domain-containing protein [Armatimonadota bacterium]
MSDKLKDYREAKGALPTENLAWQLYGAGIENFGQNGKPAMLPMPKYGPDELLARVDAIGICFSDIKLITQGSSHPRITGRDLIKNPVVPGHEVSLTIVGVGDNLKNQFAVGEKYVVQADIYFGGVNIAYGYALQGGMAQYGVLGKEILQGDEGCYLLPVKPETGYAEAALTEPWACVVASYRIKPRTVMKEGGVALFIGPSDVGKCEIPSNARPGKVILAGVGDAVDKSAFPGAEIIEIGPIQAAELTALSQERTGGRGFDDVVVLGNKEPELIEALDRHIAKDGVLCILADEPMSKPVAVDVGRVHYDSVLYVGGDSIAKAYESTTSSEFKTGGNAWFIGAAGPMGQMHVERAVQMNNGPSRILATDIDSGRLEMLRDKVEAAAKQKGIDIRFVNSMETSEADLAAIRDEMTAGAGFDDIVVLAPVPALIEEGSRHLANSGKMNIFAGVPRGTIACLDVSPVYMSYGRWLGSSGSRISDLQHTLAEAESGVLPTNRSVAAIGGIDAVGDGVKAVKEARFPGKTVIFPQIANLPLTALPDLKEVLPKVYEKLEGGRFWTKEAEDELLREKL